MAGKTIVAFATAGEKLLVFIFDECHRISRYVSTAIEEEVVDLKTVSKRLIDIENIIKKAIHTLYGCLTEWR